MESVKKHFEQEAAEFDQIILQLIPYYAEMLEALVSAIPFDHSNKIRVIDLGCGTGTITRRVKDLFPDSIITCVDMAENMIKMAEQKLADYSGITYYTGDFRDFPFDGLYDVVVSSLALHHIETDLEKKEFYQKIFNCLRPGGVFLNGDVVLGSNDFLQSVYKEKWKDYMLKQVSEYEIENRWFLKYREEDRPVKLNDHTVWLSEIGFRDIDIIWKYYNFAVYTGRR